MRVCIKLYRTDHCGSALNAASNQCVHSKEETRQSSSSFCATSNYSVATFFKCISKIIHRQTDVNWFGSLSAPTDSGLEDFGNIRNFGKEETLFFTIRSRSSFPKFCLLLACLLACLPACLVGWLVGWLAGWLAC